MFLVCKIAAASQRPTLLNWRSKQHSLEVFVFKLMTKSLFEGGFLCIHFKCILHYYQHRKRCLLQVNTSKVICFLNGCVFLYQLNTEGFLFVQSLRLQTDLKDQWPSCPLGVCICGAAAVGRSFWVRGDAVKFGNDGWFWWCPNCLK